MTSIQHLISSVVFTTLLWSSGSLSLPPPCESDIFCHGQLLKTIQMAELYSDSKTFVDMKMKKTREETLDGFNALMKEHNNNPKQSDLLQYVNQFFDSPGSELERVDPVDWVPKPKFLENIRDRSLKSWASSLNIFWKQLCRKIKDEVRDHTEQYSIIYVPNPVIVPGGRFREFYYWDSYWVIKGLLLSEMHETVKGMLENFASIVDRYGFIPNGGRIYYLMRSQPPLFIPMADEYYEVTKDLNFIKEHINTFEKEFEFWMTNHTVAIEKDGVQYKLARYYDQSSGPRPESYREDIETAQVFHTSEEKDQFYSELKAAAESGWDFSSRWFITNGTKTGNLSNIKIKSIIPVDLNAMIYWNAELLAKYYNLLGEKLKARKYSQIAQEWMIAVNKVLWHEEVGVWLDYDLINNNKRDQFYPSNLAPLWTKCYDPEKKTYYVNNVLEYLKKNKVMVNAGGIPTTFTHSGEQWDYPNAWPPLQHMVIMGLDLTGDFYAKDLAYTLAEKWVRSNYKAFNATSAMFEKYDATVVGGHGGGGEYEVQLGFGWTNGVILDLLNKYGDRLTSTESFDLATHPVQSSSVSIHLAPLITILLAQTILAAGCIGAILYARRLSPRPDKSKYVRIPGSAF